MVSHGASPNREPEGLSVAELKALSLEELGEIPVHVVSGASKRGQRSVDAPASISVVTREDIQHFGHRTLADVLNSVRGFYINNDRSYSLLGVRGASFAGSYGGRTLILINGHRLADPLYDSAFTGYELPLDVDLIEKVEVVRGPGFSIYGNNAFFSVINVVTRTGRSVNGGELSGTLASYDNFSGRLTYGRELTNGISLMLSGTLLDRAGHRELYYPEYLPTDGGIARNVDHERARYAYIDLGYRDLNLTGVWGERSKQVPTGQYGDIFNDPRSRVKDARDYVELRYQHEFPDDWEVMGRVFLDRYRYDGFYPLPTPGPNPPDPVTINIDRATAHWWGTEMNVSKILFDRNKILFGTEVNLGLDLHQLNYDITPRSVYVDRKSGLRNYAVYLQDELNLTDRLILNGSVRYDHFNTFGGAVNARGGIIYTPWKATTLKLVYGQGYRGPNAYELDYQSSLTAAGTNVGPENIRSYEMVVEQRLSPHLSLVGDLFYNTLDDLLVSKEDNGIFFFRNENSVVIQGGAIELEGRWRRGLRTRIGYTYAEVTDSATGAWMPNSPKHLAKASLAVPLYEERIYASVELQAMSRRRGYSSKPSQSGYGIVNLNLFSRDLLPGLELSAGIYNLLDASYADPTTEDFIQDAIPQDGRNFRLKLTLKF